MSKPTSKIVLFIVVLACAITACDSGNTHIGKRKMINLLVDFYKGEALIDSHPGQYYNDSLRKTVKQSVFLAHNVTQEQFDSSMMWYGKHMEDFAEIYTEVQKRLDKEEEYIIAEARKEGLATIAAGDSIDLWDFGKVRILSNSFADSTMAFTFEPNSDFEQGDVYQWQFRLLSDNSSLNVFVGANYDDGSMAYLESEFRSKGWNNLRFQTDSTKALNKIYGIVTINYSDDNIAFIDSIQLVRTRLNGANYFSSLNRTKKIPNNAQLRRQRGRWH